MKKDNNYEIPTVAAESSSLGEVKINHDVIARIVHLSCIEVPGVHSVGGGFSFSDLIPAKNTNKGVRISEEDGGYVIEVKGYHGVWRGDGQDRARNTASCQ